MFRVLGFIGLRVWRCIVIGLTGFIGFYIFNPSLGKHLGHCILSLIGLKRTLFANINQGLQRANQFSYPTEPES